MPNTSYMKQWIIPIVAVILLGIAPSGLYAQKQPAVFHIFEQYGNKKGVTLLEISEELMKDYRIHHFKSIIFEDGSFALPDIRKAISQDKKEAKKIKESLHDGLLVSGYYRLKTNDERKNRYVIFKVGNKNKVTLIYIEGMITPDQLVELLK